MVSVKKNLIDRIKFHKACESKEKAMAAAIVLFKKNIVQFFNYCLWTYDPREKPADRPFQLYDYEEDYAKELNECIERGESLLTEKTRDMGVTWVVLGVFLYRWLLFDENFLVGSRKEELVDKLGDMDTLFERLRYTIKHLPYWLQLTMDMKSVGMGYLKIFKTNGASIVGESMNENFSRQGRYKAILLDEFAFVERAETIWTACGDSAPCKIVVSTPHGNLNKFARLRKSGRIKVKTLHWKLHPHKDELWYAKQKQDRSPKDVAQELDINYIVSAGKAYYGGFIRGIHVRKAVLNPSKPLILKWDYGYHHPCCVISQIDSKGRWTLFDCAFGEDEIIHDFGQKVKALLNTEYPNYPVVCYGDPAGEQESDKSKKTSVQILGDLGFVVTSRPSNTNEANYDARKAIIEGKLRSLMDGIPALTIHDHPRTQILIEAFEGGYHYPEANRYGLIVERPVKDGYYEHPMNCIEYGAVNMFSAVKEPIATETIIKTVGDLKDVQIIEEEEGNYGKYRKVTAGFVDD